MARENRRGQSKTGRAGKGRQSNGASRAAHRAARDPEQPPRLLARRASSATRSARVSHTPLSPALREGRGKEQGNPLACGPPVGKKTLFDYSFSPDGHQDARPPPPHSCPDDRGGSSWSTMPATDKRSGVVAVSEWPTSVVPKAPLSQRRDQPDGQTAAPATKRGKASGRWTDEELELDELLALRPSDDEAVKPPTRTTYKHAPSTKDLTAAAASVSPTKAHVSNAKVPPSAGVAAPKSERFTSSQRARAKRIREGWMKTEGITAKEANIRWNSIHSMAARDSEVALLLAKDFGTASREQKLEMGRRQVDDAGLQSYRYSPVATAPTNASSAVGASSSSESSVLAHDVTSRSDVGESDVDRGRPLKRRKRSSASPTPTPVFFNPFLEPSTDGPATTTAASQSGEEAVASISAAEDVGTPVVDPRGLIVVSDTPSSADPPRLSSAPSTSSTHALLPTDDRSLSTTAIREVQRLAGGALEPDALLDLVDLFDADSQAAEVFLSLRDDALKVLWTRRRAEKLSKAP